MIKAQEFRLGNHLLHKQNGRISVVPCGSLQMELIAKDDTKDLFPVVLKAEILQRCGFAENKEYALLPQAREFSLQLPVIGNNKNEIFAWIKSSGECFGRATVNGLPVSNNFYHLHSLQNLYHGLTGEELTIKP
ncbi:MAG: hypothetical protein JWP69_1458 [Flaviaesturariibacter sp.]|nr:hypothetical protein [Flaviaesturariibacter sp.]